MEQETIIKISKKLSKILRHRPDMIGLTLDENGWANVHELIKKFGTPPLSEGVLADSIWALKTVVAENDKKRFAFNDDFSKIRAKEMFEAKNYPFYISNNGVWLTDHVPARFLIFP